MGIAGLRASVFGIALLAPSTALSADDQSEYAINGKHFDALDQPTYQIATDGKPDWYTATGFHAYHETCNSCHGPKGAGSPYGSALTETVKTLRYFDFMDTVVNGQVILSSGQTRVMPAFGTNPKVMCRLDAIYVYLRAEAAGLLDESALEHAVANPAAQADLERCLSE